jgi:3-oxoadipate enol-lactonase
MTSRCIKGLALAGLLTLFGCAGQEPVATPSAKAEPRSEWVETSPHVFLRYQSVGNGPHTVVLLHELGAALENWDEVVPKLASAQRRIIRYDQRGAGLSTKIRGDVRMPDHANDLRDLLDKLGVQGPVTLIGDTIGASVALQFASQYPQRVDGVLAMGPTAYLDPQPQLVAKFPDPLASGAAPATMTGKPLDASDPDAAHTSRTGEFSVVYPKALRTDPARLARFYGVAYSGDPTSVMLTLRMVYSTGFREAFSRIQCPVVVTRGAMFLRPLAEYQQLVAAIPNAELREIQSGHYAAVQSPELVGEIAQQFLVRFER